MSPPRPTRPAAAETLRLYARDWTAFETWCTATGRTALPATAATLTAFLTEAAPGLSARHLGAAFLGPPYGAPGDAGAILRLKVSSGRRAG